MVGPFLPASANALATQQPIAAAANADQRTIPTLGLPTTILMSVHAAGARGVSRPLLDSKRRVKERALSRKGRRNPHGLPSLLMSRGHPPTVSHTHAVATNPASALAFRTTPPSEGGWTTTCDAEIDASQRAVDQEIRWPELARAGWWFFATFKGLQSSRTPRWRLFVCEMMGALRPTSMHRIEVPPTQNAARDSCDF
jgi:hypothetical protein